MTGMQQIFWVIKLLLILPYNVIKKVSRKLKQLSTGWTRNSPRPFRNEGWVIAPGKGSGLSKVLAQDTENMGWMVEEGRN